MLKRLTVVVLISLCHQAGAQITAEEAIQKVFDILTLEEPQLQGDLQKNLTSGAWESLSYLNETNESYEPGDLQEAVPDYYHFMAEKVIIRLINQSNYNEYGMELEISYRLHKGHIELLDGKTKALKDRWEIMYLDANYLALDMGDLRVFFTHTPNQE